MRIPGGCSSPAKRPPNDGTWRRAAAAAVALPRLLALVSGGSEGGCSPPSRRRERERERGGLRRADAAAAVTQQVCSAQAERNRTAFSFYSLQYIFFIFISFRFSSKTNISFFLLRQRGRACLSRTWVYFFLITQYNVVDYNARTLTVYERTHVIPTSMSIFTWVDEE